LGIFDPDHEMHNEILLPNGPMSTHDDYSNGLAPLVDHDTKPTDDNFHPNVGVVCG